MAVDSANLTIPAGGSGTLLATVGRSGTPSAATGPIQLIVDRPPVFVTSSIGAVQAIGSQSVVPVTLRIGATAAPGMYSVTLRGTATGLPDALVTFFITVVPAPSYAMTLSSDAVTVARGGVARVSATLARAHFSGPVSLALSGATGITGTVVVPSVPSTATDSLSVGVLNIVVAPDVAPGIYPMVVRGTTAGVADRTATLLVTVTADPLQVIVPSPLSLAQAGSITTELLVNRLASVGAVTLQMEGVPNGVTAAFTPAVLTPSVLTPSVAGTNSVSLSLAARADVAPGTYALRIRAQAAGISDVVSPLSLVVTRAGVSVVLAPATLTMFQGTTTRVAARLVRTSFAGAVQLAMEGTPVGLTVSAEPALVSGDSTTLRVSATGAVAAGRYDITVRATPLGLTADAEHRVTLSVTVQAVSGGEGNVLLDWSGCTVPAWIAAQDGNGPWQRLVPLAGAVRFAVASGKGAYAYLESSRTIVVRYRSQAELSAGVITMCPPPSGTKRITGTSQHTGIGELWTWVLAGLSITTTQALPTLDFSPVPDGVHDLVAWTQFGTTYRLLLQRGIDLPDGGSLGSLSLLGPDGFFAAQRTMSIRGTFVSGDQLSHSLDYLTTAACTVNMMMTRGPVGTTFTSYGIPELFQMPRDFHQITVRSANTQTIRSTTVVMHALTENIFTLPPVLPTPDVRALAGPYKRLQLSMAPLPSTYNGVLDFRYQDGLQSTTLSASSAYVAGGPLTVAMPDFTDVAGWIPSAAITRDASVQWTLTVDGGDLTTPRCTEGRTTVWAMRLGGGV